MNRKEQKRLMVLNQVGRGVVTCREASEVLHHSNPTFHSHCHENTIICPDEPYTLVIPAQAGIQAHGSTGSCFILSDVLS